MLLQGGATSHIPYRLSLTVPLTANQRMGATLMRNKICTGLWQVWLATAALMLPTVALASPTTILFVGNSYTFGRVDPVMSYNAADVHDLTAPSNGGTFTNTTGSNPYEPHPWGGVPGIFKSPFGNRLVLLA
jgi:hypothetical protein